jgi:hypothetical protein
MKESFDFLPVGRPERKRPGGPVAERRFEISR